VHHKITDDATAIEFDFRCKIDNQYVIIDMQQWYKPDVVHRFYTYHCLNTALQLERLPIKSIGLTGNLLENNDSTKERKVKDFSEILPVITFVWMVDDTFGFTDDFVSFTMTPEIVLNLIKNHLLWQTKNMTQLLEQREIALQQLSNKTKRLDFLQKNKLIYAFQKNIVANSKKESNKYHKYLDWFELAEKTRNKLNQKSDFLKYAEDEIFSQLIRRISKETLTEEDFTYIENYEQFTERVNRWSRTLYKEGLDEGIEKGKEEERLIQEEKQQQEKLTIAKSLLQAGVAIEVIMNSTGLSKSEIEELQNK